MSTTTIQAQPQTEMLWVKLLLSLALCVSVLGQNRYVKSFDTVAQMLASNPHDIATNCIVLGRLTAGDGGGGNFIIMPNDGTATNLGTVFAFSGYLAKRQYAGPLNVLWFGSPTDTNIITAAVAAVKSNMGGIGSVYVPPQVDRSVITPDLNLTTSQSIAILDYRLNKNSADFGAIVYYNEARDSQGYYDSGLTIKGKQNPGFVMDSLSDGTAPAYPVPNLTGSIVWRHMMTNMWQLGTDLRFHGDHNLSLYEFNGVNSGSGYMQAEVYHDASGFGKFTLSPRAFPTVTLTITNITGTSPQRVYTQGAHGIVGSHFPVVIASAVGLTNLMTTTSWLGTVVDSVSFTLDGSVNTGGSYASGGTASYSYKANSATLNVPVAQGGGNERGGAIYAEGAITSDDMAGNVMVLNASGLYGLGRTNPGLAKLEISTNQLGVNTLLALATIDSTNKGRILFKHVTTASNQVFEITSDYNSGGFADTKFTHGTLQIPSISVRANNAAAIAAGLPVGALYRTGGDPDQVCVVH